jgi:UMF1 family MFS transporter
LRAWALYDWANSAVWTTVIAAVFPIYFYRVAGADLPEGSATRWFAVATTAGLVLVAVLAPVLGAIADYAAVKKKMLGSFLALGTLATAGMYFIQRGDWLLALGLFIAVEVGVSGSLVFYDALLPHVAREGEIDRASTTGYALGYLGGGVLLALNLAWIQWPQWFGLPHGADADATVPVRLAFASVALWWLLFALPLFRWIPEPPRRLEQDARSGQSPVRAGLARLRAGFAELRGYKQALLMLLAFLIYSDGIGTIIRMATIYGTEIGIGQSALIGSILLVQFVGIPFAVLFGKLAGWIGPKPAIFVGLAGYLAIALLGYFMTTAVHFLALAVLVGMVQGGTQALSRSLFASLIPKHQSAEFFGLFALSERFAGLFGPAVFAAVNAATGSSRSAIISGIGFFIAGGAILSRVNVAEGQRAARAADAAAHTAPLQLVPWRTPARPSGAVDSR